MPDKFDKMSESLIYERRTRKMKEKSKGYVEILNSVYLDSLFTSL